MRTQAEFKQFIDDTVTIAQHMVDIIYEPGTERMLINTKILNVMAEGLRRSDKIREQLKKGKK